MAIIFVAFGVLLIFPIGLIMYMIKGIVWRDKSKIIFGSVFILMGLLLVYTGYNFKNLVIDDSINEETKVYNISSISKDHAGSWFNSQDYYIIVTDDGEYSVPVREAKFNKSDENVIYINETAIEYRVIQIDLTEETASSLGIGL